MIETSKTSNVEPVTTDIPLKTIPKGSGCIDCCGLYPDIAAKSGGINTGLSSKSAPLISLSMDADKLGIFLFTISEHQMTPLSYFELIFFKQIFQVIVMSSTKV
jgi:hypothetical protein